MCVCVCVCTGNAKPLVTYMVLIVVWGSRLCVAHASIFQIRANCMPSLFPQASDAEPNGEKRLAHIIPGNMHGCFHLSHNFSLWFHFALRGTKAHRARGPGLCGGPVGHGRRGSSTCGPKVGLAEAVEQSLNSPPAWRRGGAQPVQAGKRSVFFWAAFKQMSRTCWAVQFHGVMLRKPVCWHWQAKQNGQEGHSGVQEVAWWMVLIYSTCK